MLNTRLLLFLTGLLFFQLSQAQELDPRSYINVPIGQNFIGLVYAYTDGDVYTSPDVPIEDLTLSIDGPALL